MHFTCVHFEFFEVSPNFRSLTLSAQWGRCLCKRRKMIVRKYCAQLRGQKEKDEIPFLRSSFLLLSFESVFLCLLVKMSNSSFLSTLRTISPLHMSASLAFHMLFLRSLLQPAINFPFSNLAPPFSNAISPALSGGHTLSLWLT